MSDIDPSRGVLNAFIASMPVWFVLLALYEFWGCL